MYLKEIHASGFKSFADKIKIEFKNGTTGIVGPNGSGKSNVVDAVRFVLGEQSVKSLRGSNSMTDFIFSGSKNRKPANVASVTLTFDNSDHHLPLDYQEIAIKRRIYKSGENEYFINKERCRLKDILDLFVDSGSAKESFNIISQGKVQEILSHRPEDRRVIFEEAAGVLKYKKRKEEAIKKLSRTHQNLDRIQDIISELERHLAPLQKQAEDAQKYLDTKEELTSVEVALITLDIGVLNDEYVRSKKRMEELTKEITQLDTTSNQQDAHYEKLKLDGHKLDKSLTDAQRQLIEKTGLVESLNSEKKILLERQKYKAGDVKLYDNVANLKEQELQLRNQIRTVTEELKGVEEQLNLAKSTFSNHSLILGQLRDKKEQINRVISGKVKEEVTLRHQIDTLRTSLQNNSGLNYGVKSVLECPKLTGIHTVIGKLITMDETYATAIASSLGGASQFVVVERESDAKNAIQYLKEHKLGRVTFFPLNVIQPKQIDPQTYQQISNYPGLVGIASELVHCEERYRTIILNQLGNVLVADTIDHANELSRMIGHRYKIVTLDGELVHVGGSITGGAFKTNKNFIQEKYELERMEKRLEDFQQIRKRLEEDFEKADQDVQQFQQQLAVQQMKQVTDQETYRVKNLELEKLRTKHQEVSSELASIDRLMDNTLSEEVQTIMDRYYEESQKLDALTRLVSKLKDEKEQVEEELSQIDHVAKNEMAHSHQLQKEHHDLEIKVTRMDVQLDNLLNTLSEEYHLSYEAARAEFHMTMEIEEARMRVKELKQIIRELGTVNVAAIDEAKEASERYELYTSQKEDLLHAESTLLEIIEEMDAVMETSFKETFDLIAEEFNTVFNDLFGGGNAELRLTDPEHLLDTGVDIIAQPPGKKLQHLSLLSGGEKTLTAISLLFAILKTRPVPFCILDEVEAALDEANVDRFGKYLLTFKDQTQFIVITHKKKTMEYADVLYGITMQESGVSKLVSVKLEDIKEEK